MEWFVNNLGTIIVGLVLLLVVAFLIATLIIRKKQGKSGCSCGCSTCPHSQKCNSDSKKEEKTQNLNLSE